MSPHLCETFKLTIFTSVILIYFSETYAYEKTLRKIVRDQHKMVQKPFTLNIRGAKSCAGPHCASQAGNLFSTYTPNRSTYHNTKSRRGTIIAVDTPRSKTSQKSHKMQMDYVPVKRRAPTINSSLVSDLLFEDPFSLENKTENPDKYYSAYNASGAGFLTDEEMLQRMDDVTKNAEQMQRSPVPDNVTQWMIEHVPLVLPRAAGQRQLPARPAMFDIAADSGEKPEYAYAAVAPPLALPAYNGSLDPQMCRPVVEVPAEIDLQRLFPSQESDISWTVHKSYWNDVFLRRYENLLRNPKWPSLKVVLIPRTHVDTIWKNTFDQYHRNSVSKILSNIVKKLQFYTNHTFTWNEVSHLSRWWKSASQKSRAALKRLIREERLEITTGCWVQTDEATSNLFGMVHQLVEGHQWLRTVLSVEPKVAWLTNSVSHSPTMTYLMSASGISYAIFTKIHYSWDKLFAEYQYSDLVWVQNWDTNKYPETHLNNALNRIGTDRYPKHAVLAHYLQFNSDDFNACGPNKDICSKEFDFTKRNGVLHVSAFNVRQKAEMLLEQYSKTGSVTPHNVIIAPIGGDFHYDTQSEFDYQFDNYQKIVDFVNANRHVYEADMAFGTPKDYFETIIPKHKTYPTIRGDFMNYADINHGSPVYWTGYFTTRPKLKILIRKLQASLRSAEILVSFGMDLNVLRYINITRVTNILAKARQSVARLQDRNVISGTLTVNAVKSVHNLILTTLQDCVEIQETLASALSMKWANNTTEAPKYMQKYLYRNGEIVTGAQILMPGDRLYVFNPLNFERMETVELVSSRPNIRIIDHTKIDLTVQLNPVWRYDNNRVFLSSKFYKIIFDVVIGPFTLQLFSVKETYDVTHTTATIMCNRCVTDVDGDAESTFPFIILPLELGDIQIENYKYRIIIDEFTGFVRSVTEKEFNRERILKINYAAFKSSDEAGMYIFTTHRKRPIYDFLKPFRDGHEKSVGLIISGVLKTEVSAIYGAILRHTVKIYNLPRSPLSSGIFLETKLDYQTSPTNRELEVFMSIQTDISNGMQMFTDDNGFQYTPRLLNLSRRVETNTFPITTMAYIEDENSRMTLLTDHSQGVTALQEGQIIAIMDRRILFNDGRGVNEGLADNTATLHRHCIILENFLEHRTPSNMLSLPSLTALQMSAIVDYPLDIFQIGKAHHNLCYYAHLPLIKSPFPCDISVLNMRVLLSKKQRMLGTVLTILHKHTFSCNLNYVANIRCSGKSNFNMNKIFRNVREVYSSNLPGTEMGSPITTLSDNNFASMELKSFILKFI